MQKNEIAVSQSEIAKKLNSSVFSVIGTEALTGFEKAFSIANAIKELKEILTPEYMQPIMQLQGNKLGFKTDKDKDGGYPEAVVKNCLIEAVLFGLQPFGNQFNIIAGNMYATKEGVGYLLSNFNGLSYDIVAELPRIKEGSAAVVMNIEWTLGGQSRTKKIDIPIKVNNFMGTDAVLGKAMRKARKWLYDTITGSEIPEGDITDTDAKVIATVINESPILFEDLEMLFDLKKEMLSKEDLVNAQRIIDTKEVNSYKKLNLLLQSI